MTRFLLILCAAAVFLCSGCVSDIRVEKSTVQGRRLYGVADYSAGTLSNKTVNLLGNFILGKLFQKNPAAVLAELEQLYNTEMKRAFPPSELKPLHTMERRRDAGCYEPLGVFDGEELVAYARAREQETGKAVCILEEGVLSLSLKNDYEVSYHSLGREEATMKAGIIPEMIIHTKEGDVHTGNVMLALYPGKISPKGSYHMILHGDYVKKEEW